MRPNGNTPILFFRMTVRSLGGAFRSAATNPSPFPLSPWQTAQLLRYSRLPMSPVCAWPGKDTANSVAPSTAIFMHRAFPADIRSRLRVSDGLRKCHELLGVELHYSRKFFGIDGSAKYGRKTLRGAKQVNVLPDKTRIDASIKTALLGGHVVHCVSMRDVNKIKRSGRHKVLQTGCRAYVYGRAPLQGMV